MRRSPCYAPASALLTALLMGISTHLCPVTHAASPVPYVVEFKTGEQFERQTQASTGQATGAWFVAFLNRTSINCMNCEAVEAALEANAERQIGNVIWSKIDCGANPDVAKRFGFRGFVKTVLFRNKKMYEYVPTASVTGEKLRNFVDTIEHKGVEAVDVPPVRTQMDEMRNNLRNFIKKPPPMFYMTTGCTVTLVLGISISLAFPRRRKSMKVA
uniref:Thioredoxin domain-containing protein n=1 Tax=Tetraselmis chuii TaxID=63592 RepID=A0A7S1SV27_9CHLO|mmetsp:Transcript_27189/g.48450  ORF Transcript_27189/g.48450 Transcript_27189/m.48450 type:complete len:215 (+) Transcript_27189:236-880(+)